MSENTQTWRDKPIPAGVVANAIHDAVMKYRNEIDPMKRLCSFGAIEACLNIAASHQLGISPREWAEACGYTPKEDARE